MNMRDLRGNGHSSLRNEQGRSEKDERVAKMVQKESRRHYYQDARRTTIIHPN